MSGVTAATTPGRALPAPGRCGVVMAASSLMISNSALARREKKVKQKSVEWPKHDQTHATKVNSGDCWLSSSSDEHGVTSNIPPRLACHGTCSSLIQHCTSWRLRHSTALSTNPRTGGYGTQQPAQYTCKLEATALNSCSRQSTNWRLRHSTARSTTMIVTAPTNTATAKKCKQ